jgi:NAD-dependent DNA ligase
MKVTAKLIRAIKDDPITMLDGLSTDEIATILQEASHSYFNKGQPILSDNLYDEIKAYMQKRDPTHPILREVGSKVKTGKVELPYWMGSMDKIKSDEKEIRKWALRYAGRVVVSDKLDGNSALLHVKGETVSLFTRGNGYEGQDISHMLSFVSGVPKNIKSLAKPELTVRGELIISRDDFKRVSHLGKNARNMVAGVLNAKKPDLQIARLVRFVAYEQIQPADMTPSQGLAHLSKVGFDVVHHETASILDLNAEALSRILEKRRSSSDYEVDGIVVVHDALGGRRVHGENPKHAFAFKSMSLMNQVEVIVQSVEWNVSKDGFIKPVVVFDGVELGGVVVRRATGNNARFIVDNKIGPGAKIVVTRSGDVIPAITEIVEPAEKPGMPSIPFKWTDSGCDILVSNSSGRDDIAIKQLEFFFSKVKVKGLSSGLIKKLYEAGFDDLGKILGMSKHQLLDVDGFKDKLASNIVDGIKDAMKDVEEIVLMEASNAFGRGMGGKRLTLIINAFPQILTDDKYYPQKDDLIELNGIEQKTASQFLDGLKAWRSYKAKYKLKPRTKNQREETTGVQVQVPQTFKDVTFVFTGFRNKALEATIVERGGKVNQTISKNVDVVITKDNDSSSTKVQKAKELGLEVVSLDAFLKAYKLEKSELKD